MGMRVTDTNGILIECEEIQCILCGRVFTDVQEWVQSACYYCHRLDIAEA